MKVLQAKQAARRWVERFAAKHTVIGAFWHGSVVTMEDEAELASASDVDIMLIVPDEMEMENPGKVREEGVLLDVSCQPLCRILPVEKALSTYELAGGLKEAPLYDPSGKLTSIYRAVRGEYGKAQWIKRRAQAAAGKVRGGIGRFDAGSPLLDNVNTWLFPAGVCTHVILVAALRNPTVRMRYPAAREALKGYGEEALYPVLLNLLGCGDMTAERAMAHMDLLAEAFDQAVPYAADSPFFFRKDICEGGRHVAIDAGRDMIRTGQHREAVFWMAVTWERCHRILRLAQPVLHEALFPDMLALLEDLGVHTNKKIRARQEEILGALAAVEAAASRIIKRTALA